MRWATLWWLGGLTMRGFFFEGEIMSEKNMKLMNRIAGKAGGHDRGSKGYSRGVKAVWKKMTSRERKVRREQILRELREPDRDGSIRAIGGTHRRKFP